MSHLDERRNECIQLPGYVLSLSPTDGGYYVMRAEWWSWCGDLVRMNPRKVTRRLKSTEAARQFCIRYTAEHPGHVSAEKAVEALEAMHVAS